MEQVALIWLGLALLTSLGFAGKTRFERLQFSEVSCPPGTRRSNLDEKVFQCVPVSTYEVKGAIKWLANPYNENRRGTCKKVTRVQNFDVCEDDLFHGTNNTCIIWSVIATQYCDDVGTLEFERYWAKRGCQVELFHYMMYIDGQLCKPQPENSQEVKQYWDQFPNIEVHRLIVWARRCYMCFYKEIFRKLYGHENDRSGGKSDDSLRVDVLKVQSRVKVRSGDGVGLAGYLPEFLYKNKANGSIAPSSMDLMSDVYDGVQFAILSDLYLYTPLFLRNIGQVVVTLPLTKQSLIDNLGRESEHGFNMWATAELLSRYHTQAVPPLKHSLDVSNRQSSLLRPLQLATYLTSCGVDPEKEHFISSSFLLCHDHVNDSASATERLREAWQVPLQEPSHTAPTEADPRDLGAVRASSPYFTLPAFCALPASDKRTNADLERNTRLWIEGELQSRCQPERMWLPCERTRSYAPFLPCPQQLKDAIAFDYAVAQGWCDFNHPSARIQPLTSIAQPDAKFTRSDSLHRAGKPRVRIAFFFTIYADAPFVRRLIRRLYSRDHYYLLHVDPSGSSSEFEIAMQELVSDLCGKTSKPNIVLAKDVPIIYGAATASILLSRAMAWFLQYAKGWDYFVPLTGSDYPLVSLADMEAILGYKTPHMPFLMAWDWMTSQSIQKLRGSDPASAPEKLRSWIEDADVQSSLDATWKERGNKRHMGDKLMEVRAYSYAPPLTCNNSQGFYRLDTRGFNNTQWLFPRDGVLRNGKGRAMIRNPGKRAIERVRRFKGGVKIANDEDSGFTSFDHQLRLWRKSDPGTSAAYDRESVRYLVDSEEGRKYFHFFKHMLLGSEEHYYISLLYNWPRTKAFVTNIASQAVWNTWSLGAWEGSFGGFQTHTHYLTGSEMSILRGLGKRGVFFGRKFGSKNAAVQDQIDAFVDAEDSLSGKLWSGYFDV